MTNIKTKIYKTPSKVTDEDVGEPIVLVVEWRDPEGNDSESNFNSIQYLLLAFLFNL